MKVKYVCHKSNITLQPLRDWIRVVKLEISVKTPTHYIMKWLATSMTVESPSRMLCRSDHLKACQWQIFLFSVRFLCSGWNQLSHAFIKSFFTKSTYLFLWYSNRSQSFNYVFAHFEPSPNLISFLLSITVEIISVQTKIINAF